jgi:hypothetical protein
MSRNRSLSRNGSRSKSRSRSWNKRESRAGSGSRDSATKELEWNSTAYRGHH